MEHLKGKTNGHGERLLQYLAKNGGQAKRFQLLRSHVLRGTSEVYDAAIASLVNEGVIICEAKSHKKGDWTYKLAQPQLVEAEPVTQPDQAAAELEERQCQETPGINEFTSEKILITPEMAKDMLDRNKNNRPVRKANLEYLVRAIKQGHWVMTGNAIAFDCHGKLLDGQHRLMAIIEADQTVESLVVRGLHTDAFKTTDAGAKRGAADIAAMLGYKCYVTTGCAATLLYHYENNNMRMVQKGISNTEIEKVLKENCDLEDSVEVSREMSNLLPPGIGAFCHYLFRRLDKNAAATFFQQLKTGANLKPRSPILILRDKLMFHKAGKAVLSRQAIAALIIKAWNNFRKGKDVANLSWKPIEHFPRAL